MAHEDFVISQNANWGHAGFYIDCHRMTSIKNQNMRTGKYSFTKKALVLGGRQHCIVAMFWSVAPVESSAQRRCLRPRR